MSESMRAAQGPLSNRLFVLSLAPVPLGAGYHQAKLSTHVHHNGKETVPGAADSVRWLSQHLLLRPDILADGILF